MARRSTFSVVLLLLALVGVALAWIRPAQPVQVEQPKDVVVNMFGGDGLDNPAIAADSNIHPARKCGFCMGVSSVSLLLFSDECPKGKIVYSLIHSFSFQ